jgi:hypothetical protein
MKSKRITQIEGNFMGVDFYIKPTPLNVEDLDDTRRDMIMSWYEENQPEVYEKLNKGAALEDYTVEDVENMNAWKKDVDFRTRYLKFMAETCMQFAKPMNDDIWSSDDIELSTITEAWDFFTERRLVPSSGVQTR